MNKMMYYRKPRLCISEKVLRFAQRHVESKGQALCGCALVGQLSIDDGKKFYINTLKVTIAIVSVCGKKKEKKS